MSASLAPLSMSVRVRVFALLPSGARALDPLAQGTMPCEAEAADISEMAASLVMSVTDGIQPPPPRCCVEVAVWRGSSKGAPPAMNVDGPWHQRGPMARRLGDGLAQRILRAPVEQSPAAPIIEAVTEGALEGADLYADLRDLAQLLRAAASAGEPGADQLLSLLDDPSTSALLKDPRIQQLAAQFLGNAAKK